MQIIEMAIARDAPDDELALLLEELQGALDALFPQDGGAATLPVELVPCVDLVNARCSELSEAVRAPGAGRDLRVLARELERRAGDLYR